jgi:hypothetical protein
MLQIKDTLISLDVLEKKFCCNLEKCMGACCVKGDSGAPFTPEEVELMPQIIDKIKPFIRPEGIEAIEKLGTHVIDEDNETVTPLVNNEECAYAIFDNGIAKCGIEKAFLAGAIKFQKPISCHLYPVRLRKYNQYRAVNYDIWDICQPAREFGEEINLPVYKFLKDSLVRKFGKDWYRHLAIAAQRLEKGED